MLPVNVVQISPVKTSMLPVNVVQISPVIIAVSRPFDTVEIDCQSTLHSSQKFPRALLRTFLLHIDLSNDVDKARLTSARNRKMT